ncbi:contactin-associated protein like 5-1-like isoform X1 [Mercenaria mercenaria]|uniref:contactin-associated protein like 5-1-like isoform X1 n=1 Tax=Mercenaria mercenaria TaxID=6596 RepID=UPI001E1E12C4|nr:contactin-associated protein like 5-1-like isoform X1 [Mercenaria mercenaria]
MSRNEFLGCIASFDINGENINILEAATYVEQTSAHSVTSGCSGSELTCLAFTSCYNGGRCEQQWNSELTCLATSCYNGGQKMSVFNSQARIMIGWRKISQGDFTQGTVSVVSLA